MLKRITIIEDNFHIRESLKELLAVQGDYLVHAYDSCEEAIAHLNSDAPDLVLMDIELPGMNGIEGTQIIRQKYPNMMIIIITVSGAGENVFKSLCAGACGYIIKNSDNRIILMAIEDAFKGGAPMSAAISRMVVESFQKRYDSPLSNRELEILQLISEGKTYTKIATDLFISKDTVKTHIKNIYRKLEVTSKENAIQIATQHRWIGVTS